MQVVPDADGLDTIRVNIGQIARAFMQNKLRFVIHYSPFFSSFGFDSATFFSNSVMRLYASCNIYCALG